MKHKGIIMSPGIALAKAHIFQRTTVETARVSIEETMVDTEIKRLRSSVSNAIQERLAESDRSRLIRLIDRLITPLAAMMVFLMCWSNTVDS